VSLALLVGLALTVVILTRLPRSRLRLGGVILQSAITSHAGDKTQVAPTEWVGRSGIARTDLRPVGQADFQGELLDVVAEEGFLPKGTEVEVVRDEGFRKVVRKRKEG
jgi:membrane-bound serine protease (ClpP class)